MSKPKILGANEGACDMCGGIIYRLATSLGIIRQCKDCMNTY